MAQPESGIPRALLAHDGELGDVRALLADLEVPFVERIGALEPADREAEWGLLIASPPQILRIPRSTGDTRIAVLTQDTKTLRNSLRRAGIQLLVRRPVHPATLRALVVHSLYRGPEKRRAQRVSIGAPVTYRAGWRRRPAVLVDLSVGGFRLLTDRGVPADASITLHLPADLADGRAVSLKASVLRSTPDGEQGRFVTTARFAAMGRRAAAALKAAVRSHADGPAVFEGAPMSDESEADTGSQSPAPARANPPPPAPAPRLPPASTERREAPRRQLERSVAALSEEATRVLMGRDITLGGMRVDHHPSLQVGSDVELAIHAAGRNAPLVVRAKVHRDDRKRGMVLRFHELSPDASHYLNHVMEHLPLVGENDSGDGCLVTEILATG